MGAKGSFALNGNHEMYADGKRLLENGSAEDGIERTRQRMGSGTVGELLLPRKQALAHQSDWTTGYNSTGFEWDKVPVLQRSQWLRKTTRSSRVHYARAPARLAEILRESGRRQTRLILLSHHGRTPRFEGWYQIPAKQLAKLIHRPVIWFGATSTGWRFMRSSASRRASKRTGDV